MLLLKRQLKTWFTFAVIGLVVAGCNTAPQKPEQKEPKPVFPAPPDPPRFAFERTLLGTSSVRMLTEEDKMRKLLTGVDAAEGMAFAKPFDIAVHRGRVHVTDTVHRAVLVLDFAAGNSFTIGDRGDEGDLAKPLGIAIDNAGQVYVSDNTYKAIHIYSPKGDFLRRIDVSEWANRPTGIDVTPDGTRAFLVDTGGVEADHHHVLVIDILEGKLIRKISDRGKDKGKINLPRDVHLGKDGLLYVTDGGNFRVQVFTQEGESVLTWGQPGRRLGQFSRPKGITVDPDGNIYVVDTAFGNFQIFNTKGQLLMFIGGRSTEPGPARYMLPAGIDVDEDGRIYMVDQFFRKVDVYRPYGLAENAGWVGKSLHSTQ